jgi:hypothetical protein
MKTAPVSDKIPVYEVATGAMLLRWPIDVREMVKSGEYTTTPPETIAPDANDPQPGTIADPAAHEAALASGAVEVIPTPEPVEVIPTPEPVALDAAADALAPKRGRK